MARILLVEDMVDLANILVGDLTQAGFEVDHAAEIGAARAWIASLRPDHLGWLQAYNRSVEGGVGAMAMCRVGKCAFPGGVLRRVWEESSQG